MKTHKGVKEKGGQKKTPWDTKRETNPTHTDTTEVGAGGEAVTFPTHLQTWLMWVFVSVGVYVMLATLSLRLDVLTPLSWNSWTSPNLRSCNNTRARPWWCSIQSAEGTQIPLRRTTSKISTCERTLRLPQSTGGAWRALDAFFQRFMEQGLSAKIISDFLYWTKTFT